MGYVGTVVEVPVGQEGLTGQENVALLRPSQLVAARNISFWPGPIRRESGCRQYDVSGITATITGGYAWPPAGTMRHLITTADGRILGDPGDGNFTQYATGLSALFYTPVFAEAGEEDPSRPPLLAIALAPNPPRVVTSTNLTADLIPNAPSEWTTSGPTTVCLHEGRLWWGLGHRVWYSAPGDHLVYTTHTSGDGGSLAVYPGDGDRILMLLSYKGLLLVWKYPGGIYAVDTADVQPANWRVTRITAAIGCITTRAGVILDNDILFMDHAGNFQLLSGVTEYGKVGSENITRAYNLAEWIQRDFNAVRFPQAVMLYSPARREVHIALSSKQGLHNDRRLVFDFNAPGVIRARLSDRDRSNGLWLTRDLAGTLRPACGGDDQAVWILDEPGILKQPRVGTSISAPAGFATPPLDLGAPTQVKRGQFIEIMGETQGETAFTIDIVWDDQIRQTIAFHFGVPEGNPLGIFTLGDDPLGRLGWTSKAGYQIRRRIVGSGRRLQLVVRSEDPALDFAVSRIWVSGALADERQQAPAGAVAAGAATASFGRSARRPGSAI
jgi:hypothetical protein